MHIDKIRPDPLGSSGGKPVRGPYSEDAVRPVQGPTAVTRADRVEISEEARALASQGGAEAVGLRDELSAERIERIRQRIAEGAYDAPEVVDLVARRILESGDL